MSEWQLITSVPPIPHRRKNSHKGDYGRVLVVAGSADMSGAAILCGKAALRGGAGLVRVAVPAPIRPVVAGADPCYMTAALPATDAGTLSKAALPSLLDAVAWADVVALGPGLTLHPDIMEIVAHLLQQPGKAFVVDADGLNALARLVEQQPHWEPSANLILTPHPGEASRLDRQAAMERSELARHLAQRFHAVVLLKGHESIVTDGTRLYVNPTGNPGLATGGTGDVLTGLIAALWGQPLPAFEAAQLAAYLHGQAGDLAADAKAQLSLIASDLLDFLPQAVRHHPRA